MGMMEAVIEIPAEHEKNIFGQLDAYAKKIERALHVTLIARDGSVKILGESAQVERAKSVLSQLAELSKRGNTIQEQNVDYTLALAMEGQEDEVLEIDRDIIRRQLSLAHGNQAAAARRLGISRTTLWRYLKDEKEGQ